MNNNENKQPTHIFVLKIVFFISLIVFIFGVVWSINSIKNDGNGVSPGVPIIIALAGFWTAFGTFSSAFEPEFEKMRIKKEQYIQKETEQIQEDISSREADINYRAIKKGSRAFKEGWALEKCPFCGDKVSGDEQFCDKCGKPLYSQCKSCKTINSGDSKFCKKCGKEL